ncbi:MAG: transport-associated protein [Flavisolibacter sp.]|jgi:osmotically-inducible protein OsmY|nr:transport-associated protein [Flavisolibacter sp.]
MKGISRDSMATFIGLALLVMSCSRQTKDSDIKADITTKAKTEIGFAGVEYTVQNGVVNLAGLCPSTKEKDKIEATVRKIAGVKNVVNATRIGPVVIDENFSLKQSVDSVLKPYNMATAQVSNGRVIVTGRVEQKKLQSITEAFRELNAGQIDNQLTVQ